jgi:hypothetical protein
MGKLWRQLSTGAGGAAAPVPATSDCDSTKRTMAERGHQRALSMLGTAVARSERPSDPAVQAAALAHFRLRVPPATAAEAALWQRARTAMRTTLDGARGAAYECESVQSWWHGLCTADTFAVSLISIHLCPRWFGTTNPDDRAAVLVHEWAHKWGRGVNRIFEHYCATPGYEAQSSAGRLQTPDAYMSFAYQLQTGTAPSSTIC